MGCVEPGNSYLTRKYPDWTTQLIYLSHIHIFGHSFCLLTFGDCRGSCKISTVLDLVSFLLSMNQTSGIWCFGFFIVCSIIEQLQDATLANGSGKGRMSTVIKMGRRLVYTYRLGLCCFSFSCRPFIFFAFCQALVSKGLPPFFWCPRFVGEMRS